MEICIPFVKAAIDVTSNVIKFISLCLTFIFKLTIVLLMYVSFKTFKLVENIIDVLFYRPNYMIYKQIYDDFINYENNNNSKRDEFRGKFNNIMTKKKDIPIKIFNENIKLSYTTIIDTIRELINICDDHILGTNKCKNITSLYYYYYSNIFVKFEDYCKSINDIDLNIISEMELNKNFNNTLYNYILGNDNFYNKEFNNIFKDYKQLFKKIVICLVILIIISTFSIFFI
jgi:hypothetical protein